MLLKNVIKNFLNKKNYFFVGDYEAYNRKFTYNIIYLLLFFILQKKKSLNIIQVGANDGVISDPLNKFYKENKKNITIFFFEPHPDAYLKLKKNLKLYKNFFFFNKAVGNKGKKYFYFINKKSNKTSSVQDFSGLSGFEKQNFSKQGLSFDYKKYISKRLMELDDIKSIIQKEIGSKIYSFSNRIDLITIDAEGYDDQVIYNCNIDFFKPSLINFEDKNISWSRIKKLHIYLNNKNYRLFKWSRTDTIAIKNN